MTDTTTPNGAAHVNDQAPQLDVDAALEWVATLHAETGALVNICAALPNRSSVLFDFVDLKDPGWTDEAATFFEEYDRQDATGLFVRQTSMIRPEKKTERGGNPHSVNLPALWADGDTDSPAHKHVVCPGKPDCVHPKVDEDGHRHGEPGFEPEHTSERLPLPADADTILAIIGEAGYATPTQLQDSGNGLNGYWLLDRPEPVEDGGKGPQADLSRRFHRQLQEAAKRLRSTDAPNGLHYGPLADMARIMRLPGCVNRKPGTSGGARMSRLVGGGSGARFTWAQMVEMVEAAEARTERAKPRPQPQPAPQPPSRGLTPSTPVAGAVRAPREKLRQENSPQTDYNTRGGAAATLAELLAAGWTRHAGTDGDGGIPVERPGGSSTGGRSGTVGHDGGRGLHVFSSNAMPFEAEGNYTPSEVVRILRFGGADGDPDWAQTNRYLRGLGYGDPLPPREKVKAGPSGGPDDLWLPGDLDDTPTGEDQDDGLKGPSILPTLPAEFWEQRPYLAQIRDAAHARAASADVVLHATLARLSGMLPHWAKADTGVGGLAPMNYFAAIVSDSGVGKSSDFDVARNLLQRPHDIDFVDEAPLGSGEGIAELYMGEVEAETHTDGSVMPADDKSAKRGRGRPAKTEKVRAQVRHNAFIVADEGTAMTELMHGRKGSTLGSTLRTAWSGGTLGNANASKDRYRVIPSGSYAIGLCVGFQRITVGPLLDDFVAGTPQRFAWVASVDPSIPRTRPRGRPAVHTLVWDPTIFGRSESDGCGITVADSIKDRLWEQHTARKAGELVVETLDSHRPLFLTKVAGLMAVLDKRTDITEEDWGIAEQVWNGSVAVRAALLAHLDRANRDKARAGDEAFARQQVRAAEAIEQAKDKALMRVARLIAKHVHTAPGSTPGAVRKKLAGRDKPRFDEALDMATAMLWVDEVDGLLQPGESKPTDG